MPSANRCTENHVQPGMPSIKYEHRRLGHKRTGLGRRLSFFIHCTGNVGHPKRIDGQANASSRMAVTLAPSETFATPRRHHVRPHLGYSWTDTAGSAAPRSCAVVSRVNPIGFLSERNRGASMLTMRIKSQRGRNSSLTFEPLPPLQLSFP